MEAEDPLSQLRDIHLPEPVAFWPPAAGWWVLLVIVLIALAFAWRHAILAMIQRRKLASVLAEIDAAYTTWQELAVAEKRRNQAGLDFLAEINRLLKRVVQVRYPETGAVHLTGSAWLGFLDSRDGGTAFSGGQGAVLGEGLYRHRFDADADALYALARQWVEKRYQEQPAGPVWPWRTAA